MDRTILECAHLLAADGWQAPAWLVIDGDGTIREIRSAAPADGRVTRVRGFVLPGLTNLHSHAFQRALAGTTEQVAPDGQDSFWTWRTRMYALAARIGPEDLEAIAAQLYVEMLEAGVTAVGEFHYLHHDIGGGRYADPTELSRRIFNAAADTGIALTHLPVLYRLGGFDTPPGPHQRRFVFDDVEAFCRLYDALKPLVEALPWAQLGVAPHSLRAVTQDDLRAVVEHAGGAPVHMHIAEQPQEVAQARVHLGAPPVRWLLDHFDVDQRWCLVHATHTDDDELESMVSAGLIAGLCPTTEANLGDGTFAAERYLLLGGRFGVGSDSHVSVDPAEELRLLEYGQRLRTGRRNVLGLDTASVGRGLFERAAAGGAAALQQPAGVIAVGRRADLIVLDPDHPRLVGHGTDTVLDAWIFGAQRAVRDVMVGGRWLVQGGKHAARDRIADAFAATMRGLMGAAEAVG